MAKIRKHMTMQSTNARPQPRSSERTLRGWSNLLKCWAVCDNAACREARRCRGTIRTCAPKNFAQLPEGVKGLACVIWDAKAEGLSFDAAMEGFAGSRAEAAWKALPDPAN